MFKQLFSGELGFDSVFSLVLRVILILLAISVHELSHGFAAYKLGDPTAKYDGRLSLNPLKHLDPLGALCMFFFGFGWAKPVSVNPNYFKNYKKDMALTALAGPLSNVLMAFISMVMMFQIGVRFSLDILILICYQFAILNIGLAVFNLLPIPPLDGSKIFLSLLPGKLYYEIMRFERFGFIVLAVALYLGVLNPMIYGMQNLLYKALFFLSGGALL